MGKFTVNNASPIQLSLGVSLRDDATFNNFYVESNINSTDESKKPHSGNALSLAALKSLCRGAGDHNVLIWGARGSGLTHLLQACAHEAYQHQEDLQYIPIRDVIGYSAADICESLNDVRIVCLDGIEQICGNREWEQSLFHLYNRIKDAGHYLLISSHTSPPSLPIVLPDLKSRLLGCVIYHIESLSDQGKAEALKMRARVRGMEMSEDVVRYILNRAPRDMNDLFLLLCQLDEASLQQQRKLTIPFIKEVLKF